MQSIDESDFAKPRPVPDDGAFDSRPGLPPYYKAGIVGSGLILLIVAVVGIAYLNVRTTTQAARVLVDVYEPALDHLLNVENELHEAQVMIGTVSMIPETSGRGSYADRFHDHIARADQQYADFESLIPDLQDPAGLQASYLTLYTSWKNQMERLLQSTGIEMQMQYGEGSAQYAELRKQLHAIIDELLVPQMGDVSIGLIDQTMAARSMLAVTLLVSVLLGGIVTLAGVRAIRDQHVEILAEKHERENAAGRREFEHRLNRAFELVHSETGAHGVVHDALNEVLKPGQYGEMLLADSSIAHLGRAATAGEDPEKTGCAVSDPQECPAIRRNTKMQFERNDVFDTCPFLRNRLDEPCSAGCLPVSVMGRTTGVLHIVGPAGERFEGRQWRSLGAIAAAAGDELGLIRAFATKHEQANTDTLTGLQNRRSLESRIAEITARGPYALAFIDIDHFKKLNDKHGHETGDRALRLFADVLRDSLRPADLAARWGGEEFVLVLPGGGAESAIPVIGRIRERLKDALAPATVPAFTVSAGVSDSNRAPTFREAVAHADEALLRAKRSGRDRVELATSTDDTGRHRRSRNDELLEAVAEADRHREAG